MMHGLPSLSDLGRTATASNQFLIQQPGADYAPNLPINRCAIADNQAVFSPDWSVTANATLNDAAYCFYRLTFDTEDAPITLSTTWGGAHPAAVNCWVGLTDWTTGRWQLELLPPSGDLQLTDPQRFVDSSNHCYVAVIVLGKNICNLATIGFGEPGPPPNGDGYTLFAPLGGNQTYLIDMDGNVVHDWTANYTPGATAKLMEDGHLLRMANMRNPAFMAGGTGGRLTEFDWDNNVIWYYDLSSPTQVTHHDFTRLPNGNYLIIVWNKIPTQDVIDAGRDPVNVDPERFWADSIIEVEPVLPSGGNIVWEWRMMDHLIQDFDPTKANYGDPSLHPELIDVNMPEGIAFDWSHINCVAYNEDLDQIVLSPLYFNEVWIIDHSTTAEEVKTHSGGRYGKGGDLLYRWGNPRMYGGGDGGDQKLFSSHDAHWIDEGLSGEGDLLLFANNPSMGSSIMYSAVYQLTTPINPDGSYYMVGGRYGPAEPTWEFIASPPESFYSPNLSSAQRLPGGETLMCAGAPGKFVVVDAAGEVKWEYQNNFPSESERPVFRALRYPPSYPGLDQLDQ